MHLVLKGNGDVLIGRIELVIVMRKIKENYFHLFFKKVWWVM